MTTNTVSSLSPALHSILCEDAYTPAEPKSLEEAGINETQLESLIVQLLHGIGTASGRKIAERIGLTYSIIDQILAALRTRQIIAHARPAPFNDFYYSLTENGQKRAINFQKLCSYVGPAPVPINDYILSVQAQSNNTEPVRRQELERALSGITYDRSWLTLLGPAINSRAGIFLFGPPGNGKTTLAQCLTACKGQDIWIPHAIIDDGVIIKIFDSAYHVPSSGLSEDLPLQVQDADRRWIRIKRPTVVVGGELTLDSLEIRHDPRSNTCEAPLQMKSNGGCLLIDDFGRQRISPDELLNRWIIPLESRCDYLTLPTGKKICIPFEQTILFSTNLAPQDLVDEAFMRRVPFKIEISDPCEEEFIELFRLSCKQMNVPWNPAIINHVISKHYKAAGRPFRRCHARDLMKQLSALCAYLDVDPELRLEYFDLACKSYFSSESIYGGKAKRPVAVTASSRPSTNPRSISQNKSVAMPVSQLPDQTQQISAPPSAMNH